MATISSVHSSKVCSHTYLKLRPLSTESQRGRETKTPYNSQVGHKLHLQSRLRQSPPTTDILEAPLLMDYLMAVIKEPGAMSSRLAWTQHSVYYKFQRVRIWPPIPRMLIFGVFQDPQHRLWTGVPIPTPFPGVTLTLPALYFCWTLKCLSWATGSDITSKQCNLLYHSLLKTALRASEDGQGRYVARALDIKIPPS